MHRTTRAAVALTATACVAVGTVGFTSATAAATATTAGTRQAGVDAGWVKVGSDRDVEIAWLVPGALPNHRGNLHRLVVDPQWSDLYVLIFITDYRCPSASSQPEDCAEVGSGYSYTDGQVAPGDGVTYVGDGGIDVTATLTESTDLSGPLRLRIRPATGMRYTPYAWGTELLETFRVTATGKIGPVDLADARIETAWLTRVDRFKWVGPGAPRQEAPAARQQLPLVYDFRRGAGHWTRMGAMAGRPGNAHTGLVHAGAALKDSFGRRSNAAIEVNDWHCPAGVRPPALARRDAPCTLLRTEHGAPTSEPTVASEAAGTRGLHVRDTIATTVLTPTAVTSARLWLDVTTQPAGDTIAYVRSDPDYRSTDRLFLSSTVSGRVGGVDLATADVSGGHSEVSKAWQDLP